MYLDKEKTSATEDKILQAAREVFLKKGLQGARMQEIADIAGINKALLHYYFRRKENLFVEIIKRATKDFFPDVIYIWWEDKPFDKKVKEFSEKYISFIMKNPDLPRFFINVLSQNPELLLSATDLHGLVDMKKLQVMLNKEAKRGVIKKIEAHQFIITVISLCIFPALANSFLRMTLDLNEDDFLELLEQRKKIVPEIILNWLKFDKKNLNN